ncbi:translocation/assembly module TamB domain-containing protein [Qipengyuania nanhaisediminis]|uniref:Autotransporter secretion inner membrane protein TamB n=1 Tax=Qipengyuania nanhaisediminis TaxID=604088 RepID=A0A1I5NM51_9SPHN|nr:translocation/assembly module TamB domain-containing protein [Qipengyuania nanhaisediminis]SFP22854.1 autotransporter secretion inner membrane protein TamB [Qipengyuania nanhaisediminis]
MSDVETQAEARPQKRRSRVGRAGKWLFGLLGAALLLIAGALVILNTPIGERFLADRIARQTFPNGLNISIGRIDGNIYGEAVLHDVRLSDPQGVFLTIPRAEIDWNPRGWLNNRLDIDSFVARRATLARLPEFLPSEEEGPILPGFDIAVDELEIDNLMLAPGIAGNEAQRVDLTAQVQVEDRRLFVDGDARLGQSDRLAVLIDAEPDGDNFDIEADVSASAEGAIASLLGLSAPYEARISGDGTWSAWNGYLYAESEGERVAALKLSNREGTFGLLGKIDPSDFLEGIPADALGNDVALSSRVTIDNRAFDGRTIVSGRGIYLDGEGLIDLAENRLGDYDVSARLRDPALFGESLRLENTTATATLNGAFSDLDIAHDLRVGALVSGETRLTGLAQQGTARFDGSTWTLPLSVSVERVSTGNALVDPRLVNGDLRGRLQLAGDRLTGDDLRVAFQGLAANLALRGDLAAGRYQIRGPVRADGLPLENVGRAGGTAMIDFDLLPSGWRLGAELDARVAPVTNDTLANLAGSTIRVRGGIATGSRSALDFRTMRVNAEKLRMQLDGSIAGGTTQLAGTGTHTEYGDFTVEASIADDGPTAELVFARPLTGLEDVRVAIAPTDEGFAIDTRGGSVLGPFDGTLALFAPADGPTRIDVERLTLSDTSVEGSLTLAEGGADGVLNLSGGGLSGTIALAPRGDQQFVDLDVTARNASFGGDTPITVARAEVDAEGLIGGGTTNFSGSANAQGLQYGNIFIARLAAQSEVENGVGSVDARITGQRGVRFAFDLNARFQPERIAVAAQGEFAGRSIEMPRRAVLTAQEGGGWILAPTQISYGDGGAIASGRFGGGDLAVDLKLARMPLSLADVALSDLGLGGTISGTVEYRSPKGALPTGLARVKVDNLTRSGLVLSSKPMDMALVARLDTDRFQARATLDNEDIQRGRIQALITNLPAQGDITQRLRAGRLDGQMRFQGAAESLWRLAAIDAFDLTGPVSIAANATGSLAEPRVRGTVNSDSLRVRSSLSGTDIREVELRGTFAGSLLRLRSFAGTTANGGRVSGSGTVDLEGLGERVEGRFVEIRGPSLDLRAAADNAQLLDANGLSATITGPLRIVSNGLGGIIAGRVRVNRASWKLGTASDDLRLPRISTREVNLPADRRRRVAASRPWRYLIDARADSRIDVDGMGLDSEWGADIILRGTTDDPRIGGTAEVVRGDYTFAGTRFELTRGEIDFDENVPVDPRLDIRAETEANGVNVIVTITGSATQPEVAFNSDPALPEEEILARLLFGGSITSLSATDALQLGAAVASLRGGGGMDPINQLRSAIGLDRLRIVGADAALGRGTGVALGKNIGRRFYVEIITDGRGYSATQLEFRVTSWLSLLASVSTIGRDSVVAEVSRDY